MASLSLYVLTFNCGRALIDVNAVASQFFNGIDQPPDLIFVSLQEVAPLAQSFIGGSFLAPYLSRIRNAVDIAAKKLGSEEAYSSIVARNIGMTAIMAFAKDPAAIEDLEIAEVGVGVSETGNKGAVGIRFTYRDIKEPEARTELTFVAAHLTHMEGAVKRRNEDWKSIVQRLVFSSSSKERSGDAFNLSGSTNESDQPLLGASATYSGIYKPTSHLFLAGDLNYRTSSLKPGPLDHQDSFPQPHHDESSPQHHSNLFENDQLTREREAGRTAHGLIEAEINFPPTYKYASEEPFLVPDKDLTRWGWSPHRWPSWTDRILYLDTPAWLNAKVPSAQIIAHDYIALPLFPTSDHRAVALAFTVPLVPIPVPDENEDVDDPRINPPFAIDPDWKMKRETARRYELFIGCTTYLTGTWEGWLFMVATTAAIIGGTLLMKAAFDF